MPAPQRSVIPESPQELTKAAGEELSAFTRAILAREPPPHVVKEPPKAQKSIKADRSNNHNTLYINVL